jgi:hypothetical protein
MFWTTMVWRPFVETYLVVNRVEVLTRNCNTCGNGFASTPLGERALIAAVPGSERPLFFCASCGDNIMSRIQSDEPRKHYVWDWVVPLKEPGPT